MKRKEEKKGEEEEERERMLQNSAQTSQGRQRKEELGRERETVAKRYIVSGPLVSLKLNVSLVVIEQRPRRR